MKKIRFRSLIVGLAGLVFCGLAGYFNTNCVFAEEKTDYRMTIHPSQERFENELIPGETYTGTFYVRNDGVKDFDFHITFVPYGVESETYSPIFNEETVYTEISKWISVDHDAGTLKENQEAEIKYTIKVPEDIHGGAQAASIVVTMDRPSDVEGSGVKTVHQLGYVVMGNVDGDLIKTAKILENKVPSFLFNPPIIGTSVVENTGNVYTVARYSLQVFPLFSDEEIYTNEETPDDSIVFPETKRFNQIEWEGAPKLGIFRVRQTVKIFDEESVTEKLVFLCPMWFLFIVLLLIFLIIFWIISRILKRRKEA